MSERHNRFNKAAQFADERESEDRRARGIFVGVIMLIAGIALKVSGHRDLVLIGGLTLIAGCVAWTMFRWTWAIVASFGRRAVAITITATVGLVALVVFSMQTTGYLDALDSLKAGPAASDGKLDEFLMGSRWSPYYVKLDESAWNQVKQSKFAPDYLSWYMRHFSQDGKLPPKVMKLRETVLSKIYARRDAPDTQECRWFLQMFPPEFPPASADSDDYKVAVLLLTSLDGKSQPARTLLPPPSVLRRLMENNRCSYNCPRQTGHVDFDNAMSAQTDYLSNSFAFIFWDKSAGPALRYDVDWDTKSSRFEVTGVVYDTANATTPVWTNAVSFENEQEFLKAAPFSYWQDQPLSYRPSEN